MKGKAESNGLRKAQTGAGFGSIFSGNNPIALQILVSARRGQVTNQHERDPGHVFLALTSRERDLSHTVLVSVYPQPDPQLDPHDCADGD